MRIEVKAKDFALTDAIRKHAARRIRFSLTCCDDYIQRVVVRLSDINGPKGGVDKRCYLQVILDGLPDLVVDQLEADIYLAIDIACARAGRTVVRKIHSQQPLRTRPHTVRW